MCVKFHGWDHIIQEMCVCRVTVRLPNDLRHGISDHQAPGQGSKIPRHCQGTGNGMNHVQHLRMLTYTHAFLLSEWVQSPNAVAVRNVKLGEMLQQLIPGMVEDETRRVEARKRAGKTVQDELDEIVRKAAQKEL
jgi:hypothetical protein